MKSSLLTAVLAMSFPVAGIADANGYNGPDPAGAISYTLPATSLVFEVEAECESFHAGMYAKYASKYLGIEVSQKDENVCRITSIKMKPYIESDQSSRYLLQNVTPDTDLTFLQLSSCGLVSLADGTFGKDVEWRFPEPLSGDAYADAIVSNVASEAATLYRKGDDASGRVAVQQNIMVAKTLEQKAAETASLIFDLRKKRMQIITGDTDATYSGEAMGAAVEEITRLEKEYMTMFTGYSDRTTQKMTFDVVPEKDKKMYVAFRISETAGLLQADDISGKPVALEIISQDMAEPEVDAAKPKRNKADYAVYRIPAVCTVKLSDGKKLLLQSRIPIYQFGIDSTLPLSSKIKK